MTKSAFIIFSVAAVTLLGAAIFLHNQVMDPYHPATVALPTPTPVPSVQSSPEVTSSPALKTYTNASLGLSFNYPANLFVYDDPASQDLSIVTEDGSAVREDILVNISYNPAHNLPESVFSGPDSTAPRSDILAKGATVHFYTYQQTQSTAYWSGKYSFVANVGFLPGGTELLKEILASMTIVP